MDAKRPRPSMAGAFSVGSMLQGQCELVHTSLAQLRVTLMVGNELNSTGNEMKALAAAIALLCVSSTVLAHDIYSNLSVIGMGICVVEDRIVSQWRLQCCRMVITTCQRLMKSFPPTWQPHRLMIASTVASIIHWLQ